MMVVLYIRVLCYTQSWPVSYLAIDSCLGIALFAPYMLTLWSGECKDMDCPAYETTPVLYLTIMMQSVSVSISCVLIDLGPYFLTKEKGGGLRFYVVYTAKDIWLTTRSKSQSISKLKLTAFPNTQEDQYL